MKSKLHDFLVILQRFELQDSGSSLLPKEIVRVEKMTENHVSQASVTIRIADKEVTIKVINHRFILSKIYLILPVFMT